MNEFENIGKQMPFKETEAEIDALLSRITDATINGASDARKTNVLRRNLGYVSVAAMFAIVLAVAVKLLTPSDSYYDMIQDSDTMADVLNEMGDDEVSEQVYYSLNSVSDYYYYVQTSEQ